MTPVPSDPGSAPGAVRGSQAPDDGSLERQFVDEHLRRNIVLQLVHGTFGQTGMRLVQAPTFLPAYLFAITGSEFLVGLARSLQAAAEVVSPVLGANLIGHRERILRTLIITGALQRCQILMLALAGLLLSGRSLVVVTLAALACMGFFHGAQMVMQNALRAKVIPVQRRGVVTGWRQLLAGASSAGMSYFVGATFIQNNTLGNGYAALFLLAFAFTVIGLAALAFTAEPSATRVRQRETVSGTLAMLPRILRGNPAFFRFFLARGMGAFGRMAMPFYILYAGTKIELSGTLLGVLTTVWMATSSVTNLFWGIIADRRGNRGVLIATLLFWSICHIQLLFIETLSGLVIFYVILGMASGGFVQAAQNMTLEFGRVDEIPLRLAATSSVQNIVGAIGPLLGGGIVLFLSYESLFVLTAVLLGAACMIVVFAVPEPRSLPTPE